MVGMANSMLYSLYHKKKTQPTNNQTTGILLKSMDGPQAGPGLNPATSPSMVRPLFPHLLM